MARAIEIPIKIDTEDGDLRKLEKGFKDVDKSLEKVEDGAKDAAKTIDRDLTQALKEVSDTGRKAGKDIGDDIKKGTKEAGEGFDGLKDEARQSGTEAAASFTGEMEDVVDVVQEISAQAFAGFGPAGAAAGLVAAAGLGALVGMLQQSADEAEETRQKIVDLADAIAEVDGDISRLDWEEIFRDWGNEVRDAKSWWEFWQRSAVTNMDEVKKSAEELGLTFSDLYQAKAGNPEAATRALAEINKAIAENSELTKRALRGETVYQDGVQVGIGQLYNRATALETQASEIRKANGLTEDAIQLEKDQARATGETTGEIDEQTRALEERNDAYQEYTGYVRSAAEADLDYADTLSETNETIATNGATLDRNTEAGRANERALLGLAEAGIGAVQALADTGASAEETSGSMAKVREDFINAAVAAGMSRDEAEKLADQYGLIPGTVTTEIKTNGFEVAMAKADEWMKKWDSIATVKEVRLVATMSHQQAQGVVDAVARGIVPPNVIVNVQGRQTMM